jgi:hypothetical protein
MKVSIKFNLPEEAELHLQAIRANEAWQALSRVDYKLRNIVKHGHNYKSVEELARELRNEINEALSLVDI